MPDYRDEWTWKLATGKTFAEVGGLWRTLSEKVTVAALAGATSVAMIDNIDPLGQGVWWPAFDKRCAELGVSGVKKYAVSIDNPQVRDIVGAYDVVHCSGVLYHCPNPILTVGNLLSITNEWLLLSLVVMPPVITNSAGTIRMSSDSAYLVPTLSATNHAIFSEHCRVTYGSAMGLDAPAKTWFFADGTPDYAPWWWLWTSSYVKKMLECFPIEVVFEGPLSGSAAHFFACRKTGRELPKNMSPF